MVVGEQLIGAIGTKSGCGFGAGNMRGQDTRSCVRAQVLFEYVVTDALIVLCLARVDLRGSPSSIDSWKCDFDGSGDFSCTTQSKTQTRLGSMTSPSPNRLSQSSTTMLREHQLHAITTSWNDARYRCYEPTILVQFPNS